MRSVMLWRWPGVPGRAGRPAGTATAIGSNGAHTGSHPAPTAYTLNGVACGTG